MDMDGDPLTVTDVTDPVNGSVTVNADGTVTYTPNADFEGIDTFTYTISDGNGSTDTATVEVTVAATNRPPTLTDKPNNANQTTTLGGSLAPLEAQDPDGDAYTFVLAEGTLPPGLALNDDGTFSGSPAAAGTFNSTVRVCDIHGLCTDGSLTIRVQADQLPKTGVELSLLAMIGSLLTLLGGFLVLGSRRRRQTDQ
jgi:LPXTG-motif cell wall-anchored protein